MNNQTHLDLSTMSLADLRQLQNDVAAAIKTAEDQELAQARAQIEEIAKKVGVPLADLIGNLDRKKAGGKGGSSVPVRYRNPQNHSETWTGRGRQPKWVREWIEGGNSMDDPKLAP